LKYIHSHKRIEFAGEATKTNDIILSENATILIWQNGWVGGFQGRWVSQVGGMSMKSETNV